MFSNSSSFYITFLEFRKLRLLFSSVLVFVVFWVFWGFFFLHLLIAWVREKNIVKCYEDWSF